MSKPAQRTRVNNEISGVNQVRVIEDGQMLGVLPIRQAMEIAREKNVDLIEIDPKSSPPTCKLMDLGKYKYELKKKEKASKVRKIDTKEFKVSVRIAENDLNIRIRQCQQFLEEGDYVRFGVQFRGREMNFKNQGEEILKKVVSALSDIGRIEGNLKMEGNVMTVFVVPK